jgi:1,4-alpha-glucan branching enzyme
MWIKLIKEVSDEWWDIGHIWAELTSRRPKEKVIGYCESHDQALVGDKTIMFRLCDKEMYYSMGIDRPNMIVDRGVALHKLIRLVTMSLGGEGYLTFMGNEFGHPEWIDFPREGNGWSYHYCRRQWSLADNPDTKYKFLNAFEHAMISMARKTRMFSGKVEYLNIDHHNKIMAYRRGKTVFLLNFHPDRSPDNYFVPVKDAGAYEVILSSDDAEFGGQNRVSKTYIYHTEKDAEGNIGIRIYLPSRCAVVMRKK